MKRIALLTSAALLSISGRSIAGSIGPRSSGPRPATHDRSLSGPHARSSSRGCRLEDVGNHPHEPNMVNSQHRSDERRRIYACPSFAGHGRSATGGLSRMKRGALVPMGGGG